MPRHPDTRSHASHDLGLIAAHAAGDATGSELETAMSLVAACTECAALHRDLRAIAAALPELPAPVRHRDFRLTEAQAAALRPAGWRRFVGIFAGPRFSFAAPLGTGLATIGIAVLLLSSNIGLPFAAGGATSVERAVSGDAFLVQSPGPSEAAPLNGPAAAASQPTPRSEPTAAPAAPTTAPAAPTTSTGTDTAAGDGTDRTNTDGGTGTSNAGGGDSQAEGSPTSGGKSSTASDFGAHFGFDSSDVLPGAGVAALLIGLALVVLRVLFRRLA